MKKALLFSTMAAALLVSAPAMAEDGGASATKSEKARIERPDRPDRGEAGERPERPERGMSEEARKKMFEKFMAELDTDGNGLISKEEFISKQEERFTSADQNGDGNLSPEEMKAAKEAHKKKMREKMKEHFGQKGDGDQAGDQAGEKAKKWREGKGKGKHGGSDVKTDQSSASDE